MRTGSSARSPSHCSCRNARQKGAPLDPAKRPTLSDSRPIDSLEIQMCATTTDLGTDQQRCDVSPTRPLPGSEGGAGRVPRKALPRMAAFWLAAVMLAFVLLTS